jgi:hypothetical protein
VRCEPPGVGLARARARAGEQVEAGEAHQQARGLALVGMILERTTTLPRLNGPALVGTTIDSPNGAPLYDPVK